MNGFMVLIGMGMEAAEKACHQMKALQAAKAVQDAENARFDREASERNRQAAFDAYEAAVEQSGIPPWKR